MMKRNVWFLFMVSLLWSACPLLWAEEITLTTYYPSPRGVYQDLRAMGTVGIGTMTPLAKLEVTGTTDATQVVIRANATQSNTNPLLKLLKSDGTVLSSFHSDYVLNTFLGLLAGSVNTVTGVASEGQYNTFIGSVAGAANTTGYFNSAVGTASLRLNTTGHDNSAAGAGALFNNRSGGSNSAMGVFALAFNTTGGGNSGIGTQVLYSNSAGGGNSAMGARALIFNNPAADVTAVGYNAAAGSSGYFNSRGVYIGSSAGASAQTGSDNNTMIGYQAGYADTTGANNVLLGYRAGDAITTGSNNLIIGYDIDAPVASGNNQLSIGNLIFATGVDGTGTTISTGNVGIGTNAPWGKLEVKGSGTTGATSPMRVLNANSQPIIDVRDDRVVTFGSTIGGGEAEVDVTGPLRVREGVPPCDTTGAKAGFGFIESAFDTGLFSSGDGMISLYANCNEALHIEQPIGSFWISNGYNVGIGTTSPAAKLDVNGTLRVAGKATMLGGVDPPYVSFTEETHETIRARAKDVEPHEKVMVFWHAPAHRMEVYVIAEDRFYQLGGEPIEE